jgi:hypothetical protein
VHVPFAEQTDLKVAEVIEAEKGMVAGASEMAVVRRSFLTTARTTVREVSLTELSMSRMIVFFGMRRLSRSIHVPESVANAA